MKVFWIICFLFLAANSECQKSKLILGKWQIKKVESTLNTLKLSPNYIYEKTEFNFLKSGKGFYHKKDDWKSFEWHITNSTLYIQESNSNPGFLKLKIRGLTKTQLKLEPINKPHEGVFIILRKIDN